MGATMMEFNLYYLINQAGDIGGDKYLQGSYSDISSAQSQATTDGVQHYSIEQNDGSGRYTVVFIQ